MRLKKKIGRRKSAGESGTHDIMTRLPGGSGIRYILHLEDDQVKTVKPAVLIKPYLEHGQTILASIEPPNG